MRWTKMKKTKLNPKHLYAIFAFLLSAVVVFCGVQIWQEYSTARKTSTHLPSSQSLRRSRSQMSPKKQRSRILTEMRRIRIRIRIPRRNRKTLF